MKNSIRFFTLVELLAVCAVIAILAGISIPVISSMSNKGKETQARADMNAIKLALTQFKADYSVWPVVSPDSSLTGSGDLLIETPFNSKDNGTSFSKSVEAYDHMTQSLTMNEVAKTTPTAPTGSNRYGNTKNRKYLDAPAKTVTTLVGEATGYYKIDPWGRRYNIALDWNYNGKIDLTSTYKFARETESAAIIEKVLVYSYGSAEAADDTDAFLYSWKTIE